MKLNLKEKMLKKSIRVITVTILLVSSHLNVNAAGYSCQSGVSYSSGTDYYPYYPSWGMQFSENAVSLTYDTSSATSNNQNEIAFLFKARKTYISGVKTYIIKPRVKKNNSKIIYFHGGAFVKAIHITHVDMLVDIANKSGSEIYIPLYELADNQVFPYQLNQMFKVYKKMKNNFGAENLILMGDSAGGNLVFSVMNKIRKKQLQQPSKAIVISPWMDLEMNNSQIPAYDGVDKVLQLTSLKESVAKYLGQNNNLNYLNKPAVSPINMNNLYQYPPTLYITGKKEMFYPDSLIFKNKAQAQGMDLTYIPVNGAFHVFPLAFPWLVPEARIAREQIASFINCK